MVMGFALAVPAGAIQVDPELTKALRLDDEAKREVVINLKGKLDLSRNLPSGPSRAKAVAKALKEFNEKAAEKLLKYLKSPEATDVDSYRLIWLTNSLRVKAGNTTIEKVIELNNAESIYLERGVPVGEMGDLGAEWNRLRTWGTEVAWGIKKLDIPKVWDQGFQGQGVTVAIIDSGANLKHPDLIPSLWKNPGETGLDENGKDKATNGIDDDGNGYIDDVNGWNFEQNNADVTDVDGHGSQTAGIVAGMGAGGVQTGVAPKAKAMILRACCDSTTKLFESHAWEAMEYAMENGARVISMSMSAKPPSNPNYARWRLASEAMLAAEVIHINSAGNLGSHRVPRNIGAPATNPPAWYHPSAKEGAKSSMITIGATDQDDKLRRYSSTGPVSWAEVKEYGDFPWDKEDPEKTGLVKPDVCGPSEVPSLSMDGEGYTKSFGGTSSATPHIAGVAAVLLSFKSDLTVAQMTEVLSMSAVQVGGGYSNQCGGGRVDAAAALEYIRQKFN